jgi:hypothetical protein
LGWLSFGVKEAPQASAWHPQVNAVSWFAGDFYLGKGLSLDFAHPIYILKIGKNKVIALL